MRKLYRQILKNCFYRDLIRTRTELALIQSQMAGRLAMDDRSYINLDHGKSCCSAITLVLYLLYCCRDPVQFLEELRRELEAGNDTAA